LTQRDYLNDPAFSVALWGGENHEELREALLHPTFAPYLGRKSCPLAAPMAPKVVEAEGPVAALHMAKMPPWLEKEGKKKGEKESKKPYRIHSDPHPTIDPDRVERRWDVPLSREDWFFAARDVHVQDLQGEEA
jgi:CRISPR system Cascade subunit CasD